MDVTPLDGTTPPEELPTPVSRCASLMTKSKLPDCGAKQRILPSFHPETIPSPLGRKAMQLHSWLGTCTRNSSESVSECQMRMSEPAHVANSAEYSRGKTTSFTISACPVFLSSATRSLYCTRYTFDLSVPAKKNSPCESIAIEVTEPRTFCVVLGMKLTVSMIMSSPSPLPTRISSPNIAPVIGSKKGTMQIDCTPLCGV
mmetsp:Transcript_39720/g.79393  ORF Transcript_39720/g.79393 Transcript_39720/m.79393 type:complete len:201 (-) Transcript_39720:781-1383(-)